MDNPYMQELLKQLLKEKKFTELEDRWIESIGEKRLPLNELLEIAQQLKKINESNRAYMLLEILAEHLAAENLLFEAIEVYKNMAYFTNDDTELRKRLVVIYKRIYKDSPKLDSFLELSGIEKGGHLFKNLEKLNNYLAFDVGNVFYFDRLGIGEVVAIRPERDEVIIDFEKQKGYLLKIDVAKELLKPIDVSHFLYKKYKNLAELKEMAKNDPYGLVKFLLKSFNEPLSSQSIKTHLKGIIEESQIDRFWERVKRQLESDDEIEITGSNKKLYQYTGERVDKTFQLSEKFKNADIDEKYEIAEECLKKHKNIFEKFLPELLEIGKNICATQPWLSVDILFLCKSFNKDIKLDYEIDDVLKYAGIEDIVRRLKSDEHKKMFLKIIKERKTEYPETFKKIFYSVEDFTVFDEIEKGLKDYPSILSSIHHTVFSLPKNFPFQYQWLLKKISRGELVDFINPTTLYRVIESLNYVKGIRPLFFKILNLERFDELVRRATESDARHIQHAIMESVALEDYEKNDFLRIIEFHFPHLFDKEGNVIYATEESLRRRKEELEYILNVEIPQNKKEISQAREYGDLSENFEYKVAKERQDQLYQKVREIENELNIVKVIDLKNVDTNKVSIGTKVVLVDEKTKKKIEYTILGRWDTDFQKNIISNESPLGKRLLGRVIGEKVEVNSRVYEIINVVPITNP